MPNILLRRERVGREGMGEGGVGIRLFARHLADDANEGRERDALGARGELDFENGTLLPLRIDVDLDDSRAVWEAVALLANGATALGNLGGEGGEALGAYFPLVLVGGEAVYSPLHSFRIDRISGAAAEANTVRFAARGCEIYLQYLTFEIEWHGGELLYARHGDYKFSFNLDGYTHCASFLRRAHVFGLSKSFLKKLLTSQRFYDKI